MPAILAPLAALILLVGSAFLALRLPRLRGAPRPAGPATPAETPADPAEQEVLTREMSADPVCGVFVAHARSLTTVRDGAVRYFCSAACYRAFLARADDRPFPLLEAQS